MDSYVRKFSLAALILSTIAWPAACAYPQYGGFDEESGDGSAGAGGANNGDGSAAQDGGGAAGKAGGDAGGMAGSPGCKTNSDCIDPLEELCDTKTAMCVECLPGATDSCGKGLFCSTNNSCEPGCKDTSDCTGAGAAGGAAGSSAGGAGPDAGKAGSSVGGAAGAAPGGDADTDGPAGGAGSKGDASVGGSSGKAGAGGAGAMACDPATHVCFGCVSDAQCLPGTLCDTGTGKCLPGCNAQHACHTNHDCCGGDCANLAIDEAHCGGCTTVCAPQNAVAKCSGGKCGIFTCNTGYADCNAAATDGCEVAISKDPANCGVCGKVCTAPPNGEPGCSQGLCSVGACAQGFADCNGNAADGCEANLQTLVTNCGKCGLACDLLNATSNCQGGKCNVSGCKAGFSDCDKISANGCEINAQTDPLNCGTCAKICQFTSAGAQCVAGVCKLDNCLPPTADCNGNAADGCEVNKNTDVANCGGCGAKCNLANAVAECSNGECAVKSCNSGFTDCDSVATNGCEAKFDSDALNCGACGKTCSTNNGTPSCAASICSIACTAGFSDCDADVGNGCEIAVQGNVDNCGACGNKCSTSGGTPNCVNGQCGLSVCQQPYADCNGSSADGCEVNIMTSADNCDGCGKQCFVANGTPSCTGGVCHVGGCNSGFADCNGFYQDGCEAALNTPINCGACGQDCALPNAKSTCATNGCQITTCLTPYGDCDGSAVNGCEIDTNTNILHCGACGNVCNGTHGQPTCQAGSCGIVCAAGFGNCNANPADGCETAVTDNPVNCGACGAACTVLNGQPTCYGTSCGIASCNAPFDDCDFLLGTGCETNTQTNLANCGSCGHGCNANHGTPGCAGGSCSITCDLGYGNCDNNVNNGCETDVKIEQQNCGTCGHVCAFANAQALCINGGCVLGNCLPGFGDCDGAAANGCETNLKTTTANCGACGAPCNLPHATNVCTNGSCSIVSCTDPWADCDGQLVNGCEVNTATSTVNCGACGTACNGLHGTPTCANKQCGIVCDTAYANCDNQLSNGCEVSTNVDVNNCATCGHVCSASGGTPNCVAGVCGISSCAPGLGDCDGNAGNGCETNLSNNVSNCNVCGHACTAANGTPACVSSACTISSCFAGWANCNGLVADGCETNLKTLTNCGACGVACSLPNAVSTCASGTCLVQSCNDGRGNCDAVQTNGCETNTYTSVTNCGACGNTCSSVNGTPNCVSGVCTIACSTGFGNCDSNPANGCETQLTNNVNNCGGCGIKCNAGWSCINSTCQPNCVAGTVTLCDQGLGDPSCGTVGDPMTSYWFDFDTATKVAPNSASADLSKGHADCCNWNVWNGATQVDTGQPISSFASVVCGPSDGRSYSTNYVMYSQPNMTVICLRTAAGKYFKYIGEANCCGVITIDYNCGS